MGKVWVRFESEDESVCKELGPFASVRVGIHAIRAMGSNGRRFTLAYMMDNAWRVYSEGGTAFESCVVFSKEG